MSTGEMVAGKMSHRNSKTAIVGNENGNQTITPMVAREMAREIDKAIGRKRNESERAIPNRKADGLKSTEFAELVGQSKDKKKRNFLSRVTSRKCGLFDN
jgi:hypothetical protein